MWCSQIRDSMGLWRQKCGVVPYPLLGVGILKKLRAPIRKEYGCWREYSPTIAVTKFGMPEC